MESTNPFLSNANNGQLQFEANTFGKQQQQPTNGSCAENEENIHYRDHFEAPSNGKHPTNGSGFDNSAENPENNDDDDEDDDEDDDDLGPETDVDAVDEGAEAALTSNTENLSRELFPEKIHELREDEDVADLILADKDQVNASPIPAEPDQHALIPEADNVADSEDSEDEWNYYPNKDKERSTVVQSGEAGERKDEKASTTEPKPIADEDINDIDENHQISEAGPAAGDSNVDKEIEQPELIDSDICAKEKLPEDLEDMDFQLNPNAAEFVPVSPPKALSTRANLNEDFLLSGSPQKQTPEMDDIPVPSQGEFQVEISLRPHETENSNGETAKDMPPTEFTDYLMDRQKSGNGIGLDESEISSTKAEFGDESTTSFMTATDFQRTGVSIADDSFTGSEREDYDIAKDPMAMSFTPGDFQAAFEKEGDDLNAIHQLNDSDLVGDEDINVTVDEPFTAQSPELHPELSTLVTPDTDHPPPTTAFPNTMEIVSDFVENSQSKSSPASPEPLIKNETSLMSGLVELIPSSCIVNDHEAGEPRYQALDTSSPLDGGDAIDNAFALSPEPIAFCGVSNKVESLMSQIDIESNASPADTETQASPSPALGTEAGKFSEVDSLLAAEFSPSPLPDAALLEPEETPVLSGAEKVSAVPDMFSFEAVERQESPASPQPSNEAKVLDEDKFESHQEVYSPILDAELNVSQAMLDNVVETPPISQNKSGFSEEVNTSPDEQFKLVLDQSDFNESPAGIEKRDILDEFKPPQVADVENVTESLGKNEPAQEMPQSKPVFDMACPPFSTGNFSRNDLANEEVAEKEVCQLSSQPLNEGTEAFESKEKLVETETDSEAQKEAILPEEAKILAEQVVAEVEQKTLETLVNEVPTINAPVMNLSESMQEFTGLEKELNPEPQAPLSNGVASDLETKIESQSPAVEVVEKLVEKKFVTETTETTELKPEVEENTEKKEETEPKTDQSSVVAPLAAATAVVAAAAATVAASGAVAAKTTKAKAGVKAAPRTSTATKTTNKSTPTSPTKAASATQRATGTSAAKKPALGTASRPKQLETTKTSVTSTTSKSPAAKSTAAARTTTTTKTTVLRTSTLAAPKPKPTTTSSRPATASLADKKPTTNGEAKPSAKPAAPKPASRPTTGSSLTASKTLSKTTTAARPASATAAAPLRSRPASATAAAATAAKSKPAATGTTSTTAAARPKSSPAPAAAKVRSTLSKSPATDKQTKETTNKQLSSARTTGSTLSKSSGRPSSTGTTTMAKRSLASKNTQPAAPQQPQKKPAPITRPGGKLSAVKNAAKTTITSTTKTEVEVEVEVVQNGVSEVHEKKTVITTNSTVEEDVPQKDASPVTSATDNQLIMTAD